MSGRPRAVHRQAVRAGRTRRTTARWRRDDFTSPARRRPTRPASRRPASRPLGRRRCRSRAPRLGPPGKCPASARSVKHPAADLGRAGGPYFECSIMLLRAIHLSGVDAPRCALAASPSTDTFPELTLVAARTTPRQHLSRRLCARHPLRPDLGRSAPRLYSGQVDSPYASYVNAVVQTTL